MKNHFTLLLFLFIFIFTVGCSEDEPINTPKAETIYSFFVAGHTYGTPGVDNAGLHPLFEAFYDTINAYGKMRMGFLTGDIVLTSTNQNWDEVDASLQQLNMPVYFAYGNHDVQGNSALVENRYGTTYKAFTQDDDLFILLNPNIDAWRISGTQLDFLTQTLDSLGENSEHIFIFFHQLIWWENDNIFNKNIPNSFAGKADSLNYWTAIEPTLNALKKPVFLFAGDVGATNTSPSLMYYKDGTITYISSGMGYGQKDNFIIVEVLEDKNVIFKVKGLNCMGGSDCMGSIEDYPPL